MNTSQRKSDHIHIILTEDVTSGISTGLEKYQFEHNALPEIDFNEINLDISFLGHSLRMPLLISSMTGGTKEAEQINRILATVAQESGIALGVGSQRAGMEDSSAMDSFRVRQYAPDILLFANIGAVQLNYGFTFRECQLMVDSIQANVLLLHLNPLQEALQPEGNTNFSGLLKKIETICKRITVPVVVKEVGWGISGTVARRLESAGVAAIDVAGAGGTSWSQVEKFRIRDEMKRRVAAEFVNWGLPTAECLIEVKAAVPHLPIIASGGLRSGLDVAKCIALGASMGGMAGSFLKTAVESEKKAAELITEIALEIKICMFAAGIKNIDELKKTALRKI